MIRVFYFLARKLNYSISVAIYTVIMGLVIISFGYYLGTSFLTTAFQQVLVDIKTWIPWVFMLATGLFLIQFGLLAPIKIPAFYKFSRDMNKHFKGNKLNRDIKDEELIELYNHFTNLPIYNLLHAVLFTASAGIFLFGFIVFGKYFGDTGSFAAPAIKSSATFFDSFLSFSNLTPKIFNQIVKSITISEAIILVIFGISTYLLTDILTGQERATCYNELRKRNYNIAPKALIGLRLKFSFIVVLMVISLLTFGALIERGRLEGQENLGEIISYFLISVLAGLILMYVTANSILRVFRDITRVAHIIAGGGYADFNVLPLESEFADIEYTIMEMNREIVEHRRNLEKKVEERTTELRTALTNLKERDEMVQKQLDMAGTIQRGILPGSLEDWNELSFSVRYFAMDKIGGDFYDIHQMHGNKIGLYVADVSGHGIPAALVTTMAKISFGNAFVKYDSPRRIFQEVNQEMLDHVVTQDYLTCFLVTIDDEYNITYSNASHQKGIILRTKEEKVQYLDTGGLFIGAIEDARETYEEKVSKLNYGDRLILYTDGIPEAMNSEKEVYSNERFEKVMLEKKDLQLEDFTNGIIEDLQRFMGHTLMQDDITFLVVELKRDETIDIIREVKRLIENNKQYEAIDRLKKGLEHFPNNQKLIYNLAKTYFRVNDFEKVIIYIEQYIQNDEMNKFAYYLNGAAYYHLKNYDKAIEYLEKAVNIDAIFVNALFALGMTYKNKGQKDEAGGYFEKVCSIDADHKMAIYELNSLKS